MITIYNRYEWADIAKGIGIFLMVFGHSGLPISIHDWIYSFHMPFFFILSGFFFQSGKYSLGDFIKRKVKTLLVPYVFFVTIIELLRYGANLIGLDVPQPKSIHDIIIHGKDMGATWFLLSLFLTEVFYHVINKVIKNMWMSLLVILVIFSASYYCYWCDIHISYKLEILGATMLYYYCGHVLSTLRWSKVVKESIKINWGGHLLLLLLIADFVLANVLSPVLNLRLNRLGVHIPTLLLIGLGSYVIIQISHWIEGHSNNSVGKTVKRFLKYIGEFSIVLIGFSQITLQLLKAIISIFNFSTIVATTIRYVLLWMVMLLLIAVFKKYIPFLIGKSNIKQIITSKNENTTCY